MIHDGSRRNCAVALRDGHAEPREAEAYLKQYVEVARGEPARLAARNPRPARRSSESAIAAEAFMSHAG
jgi:hypothetical protein